MAGVKEKRLEGLLDGLILLLEVLRQFSQDISPKEPKQQLNAIKLLNDNRFKALTKKVVVDKDNAEIAVTLQKVLTELIQESKKQFDAAGVDFKTIKSLVDERADEGLTCLKEEEKAQEQIKKESEKPKAPAQPAAHPKTMSKSPTKPATADSTSGAAKPTFKDSAELSCKELLRYLFDTKNKKQFKLPEHAYVYGLSRIMLWDSVMALPPNNNKITQKEGPNQQQCTRFQNLFNEKKFDELLPLLELKFVSKDADGFRFWFDAQRYIVLGLEQKGGAAVNAANEIKFQLAKLLSRVAGLPKLFFKGKDKVPFASKETQAWLDDEVTPMLASGQSSDEILSPIMGEEYEQLNQEFEKACEELPKSFEENAVAMQKSIAGEIRSKGRFLRKLNLANFCYNAKQYSLAKGTLAQLTNDIDKYNLIEWESALCVSVWQSAYLTNLKLTDSENSTIDNAELNNEQQKLLTQIGNYDVVRALKLSQKNSDE